MRDKKSNQSGNVFFTLFGAVGLVGVLGASTMTILKGPVKSMSEVTKRTVAENNMIAAGRLSIVAVRQQTNEDCDSDNFVEPLPWDTSGTGTAPTGGGFLPSSVGASRQDPWGTTFGYCSWDHGTAIDNAGCGGASQRRLRGANVQDKTVIAVISAGPNRVFETTCNDSNHASAPYVGRAVGSDDMILEYTYADSEGMAGGLWNVKSGDLKTAEIDKNLEIKNQANAVVMAFDQTTDTSKPSLKVDFISKLTPAKKGVEMLSNIMLGTNWLSSDGDNEGLSVNANGAVTASGSITAANSITSTGTNSSFVAAPRDASGDNWVFYNPTGDDMRFWRTTGGDAMIIKQDGKVGIGTTAPNANVRLDVIGAITAGREGYSGTYDSTQVQGIWSIGPQYKIDTAGNTFGNQYGIVYAHTNAGTTGTNKPIAGWGHQVLFTENGVTKSAISLTNGNGYFLGNVGIGTDTPGVAVHIEKPSPIIILQDSDNLGSQVAAQSYISLRGSDGVSYGWVGDTSATDNILRLTGNGHAVALTTSSTDRLTANLNGSIQIPGFINDTGSATAGLKFISGGYMTMSSPSSAYDIWLQGNTTSTAAGDARNLALLGNTTNDTLYVNHGSEYTGGTIIGGPVTWGGAAAVTAANHLTTKAYVDARVAAGTGFVEQDPQVGTVTSGKWCTGAAGSVLNCTSDAPTGDNLGAGGTTAGTLYSNGGTYGYLGLNGTNYMRFSDSAMYMYQGGAWTYYFTPTLFAPYNTNVRDLGTASLRWKTGFFTDVNALGTFLANTADTAALPSYSWNGDDNTGLWRPGADIVGVTAGGAEVMRFYPTYTHAMSKQIKNLAAPTAANDAATKAYVDAQAGGANCSAASMTLMAVIQTSYSNCGGTNSSTSVGSISGYSCPATADGYIAACTKSVPGRFGGSTTITGWAQCKNGSWIQAGLAQGTTTHNEYGCSP